MKEVSYEEFINGPDLIMVISTGLITEYDVIWIKHNNEFKWVGYNTSAFYIRTAEYFEEYVLTLKHKLFYLEESDNPESYIERFKRCFDLDVSYYTDSCKIKLSSLNIKIIKK